VRASLQHFVGQDGILRVGWQPALLLIDRRVANPPQAASLPYIAIEMTGYYGNVKTIMAADER
jgi:hypothetical protein